jgi:hypothetical protein
MNPSRRGVGAAGKAASVVVLIILVLGAVYFVKFSGSSSQGPGTNPVPEKITGMPSLFYDFTQMRLYVNVSDPQDGFLQDQTYTYTVLGTGVLNSTQYTKVQFATVGQGNDVVVWYNSTGGIGEVQVVGVRNYVGNGTQNLPFFTTYSDAFGALLTATTNSTLFSRLTRTNSVTTKIGPTQMNVTSYTLPVRFYPYTSLKLSVATIPGTDAQFVTYLDETTYYGSTNLLQVTSLTR